MGKKILLGLVLILLLFTGCINFDVHQKIKRNGHYDMDFTISTSEEYKMVLNGLSDNMQVAPSVKDKSTYSEDDTSVTWSFSDIDPEIHTQLFVKVENETKNEYADSGLNTDSSMFDSKNFHFEKEFNFPYYEYTYTITTNAKDPQEEEIPRVVTREYISDDANRLSQDVENSLFSDIEFIYDEYELDLIIVTGNLSYSLRTSELAREIDSSKFISIYLGGNTCSMSSNLYSDTKLSSFLRNLKINHSGNCANNPDNAALEIMTSIKEYLATNDIDNSSIASMNSMTESLGEMFKMDYTVEVFGTVTESTGNNVNSNTVNFDISLTEEEVNSVSFKEFFLAAFLGKFWWLYILIIILAIVAIIVFPKIKQKRISAPLEVPRNINPQLLEFIQEARGRNQTDNQIKEELLSNGWLIEQIDSALGHPPENPAPPNF